MEHVGVGGHARTCAEGRSITVPPQLPVADVARPSIADAGAAERSPHRRGTVTGGCRSSEVPVLLQNLPYLLIAAAAIAGVVSWLARGGSRRPGRRERAKWIEQQLAEQEAVYPGGRFSEDEYLARLEVLEERWDDRYGA